MSLGIAFRQIVEAMPEDQRNDYRKRIMTKVIKQFGEIVKKEENDILNNINDLVSRLHKRADIREQITSRKSVQEGKPDKLNDLLREAATTINILAERIIDSENTSALRVHSLEQQLLTKQAYIEYLEKRLEDSQVGFVKCSKEWLAEYSIPPVNEKLQALPLSFSLDLAEEFRKEEQEFKEKYGELIDVYGEESQDIILEIHQHVITENATILKETDGQFSGGAYDVVYQLDNVEIDLGKTETRTYFFTMEWNTSMKEPLFYSLEVYAKPN